MKCVDCKFFKGFPPPHEYCGDCEIELPPWLTRHIDETMFVSRNVFVNDGCDLHSPKEAAK